MRCVYHGWKFDAAGNCVDMPNVPPEPGLQATRSRPRPTRLPSATASSGSTWARAPRPPPLPQHRGRRCCPRARSRSSSCSASATGCRRSKATSTPRISASCMPAASTPTTSPRTACSATRSTNRAPEYHVDRYRLRHDVRRLPPGRAEQDLLALRQFPVSVLDADAAGRVRPSICTPRLGPDGRQPHDVHQPDAGAGVRRRSAADRHGRLMPAAQPRLRIPAEHDRLVRPLAARRRNPSNDWLIDREAQTRGGNLHRDRRHPSAGPGDHREHGASHRPCCPSISGPAT